ILTHFAILLHCCSVSVAKLAERLRFWSPSPFFAFGSCYIVGITSNKAGNKIIRSPDAKNGEGWVSPLLNTGKDLALTTLTFREITVQIMLNYKFDRACAKKVYCF
ncbi:MAG: hypothetical protein D6767_00085, partial [Candidatus Hydrogenedentota bacterium]